MALNSQYMLAVSLQELFRDKSGEPLAGGFVYFFRDSSRTTPKPVYKLSGSPPNYTYVELPNPVPLTAAGTFSDGGSNDIVVYYYPYDDDGNVDLYYVVVTDSSNDLSSPEFTREAWPNFIAASSDGQSIAVNYIPNGQFLSHTDLPATDTKEVGEIRAPITDVAYGGWTFERPVGSTAKDIVTFQRTGSYVTNPEQNPRYSIRIKCEAPAGGDSFKDLRIKFNDVNSFASDTEQYTVAFNGVNNAGGEVTLDLILIKNFGTGGDSTTEQTLTTFTINGSNTQKSYSFSFGDNENKVIGTQDDDYIQLALRCPVDTVFDVTLVDFILADGDVSTPAYPVTTTRQNQYRALTMPVPAYDGSDVYLPLRLTPKGFEYDRSNIGKIFFASYDSPDIGELLCDGGQYETAVLSPDGIPYARLQSKLFNTTFNIPIFGTGGDYLTAIGAPPETTNALRIVTNKAGPVTNSSDGTAATGFTFNTLHVGNTGYFMKSFTVGTQIYIESVGLGVGNIGAATSGFTVGVIQPGQASFLPAVVYFIPIAAATLASDYFTIDWINAGGAAINYYVWFKVDGVGSDPAIAGRLAIEVDLTSADTALTVGQKIRESLNGWQLTNILMTAGSTITGGDFFNINTITVEYYVWYKVDNAGTDPKPVGKLGIEVDIASTDTAAQVVTKTQIAINKKYFATPDLRGYFIRGWDNGAGIDVDADTRFEMGNSTIIGDRIGTVQLDLLHDHTHDLWRDELTSVGTALSIAVDQGVSQFATLANITSTGGQETRPKNVALNYVIKY